MDAEERIIQRLEEMIDIGKQLSVTRNKTLSSNKIRDEAIQWKMSSLNILLRGFGENSIHYKEFAKEVHDFSYYLVQDGNNILIAARDDMRGGYLADMKELLEAEILSDFMGQAEELLSKGYHPAAAVVAGCVLEDAMRKLCEQHPDIELPDKPSLGWMNDRLRENGVYNSLTHKAITSDSAIRNSAAHGKWDEFDKAKVEVMLASINSFMQKHFG